MTEPAPRDERRHLFDDPANVRRLLRGFYVACALAVALELILVSLAHLRFPWERGAEHHQPVEHWFGFYPAFALVGVIALVLVAKFVLRPLVMRREDHYGDD